MEKVLFELDEKVCFTNLFFSLHAGEICSGGLRDILHIILQNNILHIIKNISPILTLPVQPAASYEGNHGGLNFYSLTLGQASAT